MARRERRREREVGKRIYFLFEKAKKTLVFSRI